MGQYRDRFNAVKRLRITIDRDLKFDKYVLNFCSKAN